MEMDYLGEGDFDTIYALCMERDTIGMTCSSTPTGRRSKFYQICTQKELGFQEHYHPTQHNPMWSDAMEEEFRNTYDKNAYDHEVLAEFGVEEAGVFDKDKVEEATQIDNYAYFDRDKYKPVRSMMDDNNVKEIHILPEGRTTYYPNVFRCMGVDWDNLRINNTENKIKLYNFLYKDYVFFLKRKKETFDSFVLNKNCPLIK